MKFQVRQGFVCHMVHLVDTGDGTTRVHESQAHPGQIIDLSDEQATRHAHQLEPKDAEAVAWLDSRNHVAAENAPLTLPDRHLQAIAQQLAQLLAGAVPAASKAMQGKA